MWGSWGGWLSLWFFFFFFDIIMEEKAPILRVPIFKFAHPTTKQISFHTIIRSSDAKSMDDLTKATTARNEMAEQLEKGEPGSSTVVAAIERYIPYMYGLVIGVEGQPHIRLNDPLCFTWTSGIGSSKKSTPEYTYRFEVVMVLISYGFALANRAWALNETTTEANFEENSKQVAHFLRLAAGVFDYVHISELPRWVNMPAVRPAETFPHITTATSHMCIAAAQDLTVKKAVAKTGTSKAVVVKLAAEVWRRYEAAQDEVKAATGDWKKALSSTFVKFLEASMLLGRANAYRFAGMVQQEAQKLGLAVSYLNVAAKCLQDIPMPTKASSDLAPWKAMLEEQKAEIEHFHRAYTNENDLIVYDRLTDEKLLDVPEPKGLMTPVPYNPPYPAFAEIH
eukprot:TRINITY_DN3174_c0_g1_i1.p1 TRINITY_DN3174_c0_g1~~TRINITY_DN3174_c0_g1_i1.p1  ORF type:complete len:395 (-),score=93.60 TRINITY_DN3174_c0_g1_i1:23-1207(-)